MNRLRPIHFLFLALCLLGSHPGTTRSEVEAAPGTFAIVNARIFNGTRMVPRATVVVAGGRITAVGPKVKPPKGAEVIDGSGAATLLPGFIDAHTHLFPLSLERALVFGVTTELDMFTDPGFAQFLREALIAATSAPAKAFGLTDRGRIAKGLRADLVLVRGNPGKDVTATRDILRIWKGGHPVERPTS
jgi:imidazolonepropionase-like amidohydrolase